MSPAQFEVQLIACLAAVSCALPGSFLMLRQKSMMSDAISHSLLPGIVLAFLITESLTSPFLVLGAALSGLLLAFLIELLGQSKRIKEDAAIGLSFPALFSIGVILVSKYTANIHLDIDAVLLGELAFAPFDRITLGGLDIGPKAIYTMGSALFINLSLLLFFYKELKLSSFDPGLTLALGFAPALIHYSLMASVSLTAVTAFDAVGSILVVGLMIMPPATAYLLSKKLPFILLFGSIFGCVASIGGYWAAYYFDLSIAGCIIVILGLFFIATLLLSPSDGYLSKLLKHRHQKLIFAETMILVHLLNHSGTAEAEIECNEEYLYEHLNWSPQKTNKIKNRIIEKKLAFSENSILKLTEDGQNRVQKAMLF